MISISNKMKRVLTVLLCLCVLFSTTACTKSTKVLKDVDQICVSGAYTESWMNVFTNEDFIKEMVDIYNSINYVESDEAVDMMTASESLSLTFSKGNDIQAKFIVDKNGIFSFEAGGQSYEITSDFDFEYVKELVREQQTPVPDSITVE